MTVFLVCWSTVVLVVCSAGDHVTPEKSKKPNFIVFLMDDVRVLLYSTKCLFVRRAVRNYTTLMYLCGVNI